MVRSFLKRFVPNFNAKEWVPFFCETCAFTKSERRRANLKSEIKVNKQLDLLCTDVLGPVDPADILGNKYILTLRDHATTFSYCFPLKARSEVDTKLTHALTVIKNQLHAPKYLRSDNAKEYTKGSFQNFLLSIGTTMALTTAYTPEQNGEAERLNRTLGDMARAMLKQSGLPQSFWTFAYKCATFIHNRLPNKRTEGKTPLELWVGIEPQVNNIYPFGAKAYVHVPKEKRKKLEDRSKLCFLVGYLEDGRGWYFWDCQNNELISLDAAEFVEFGSKSTIQKDENKGHLDHILNAIQLRLGETPTDEICESQDKMLDIIPQISDLDVPKTLAKAKKSQYWPRWERACHKEIESCESFNVWDVVDPTPDMHILDTRFVFALKRDEDDCVIDFKARLVVKGYTQQLGIDCFETFAPTASLLSLHLLLALAARNSWILNSFDVSTAYLHSSIDETVYIWPPVDVCPNLAGKVLRLNKSLYGTKQAPRCWWKHFQRVMTLMNFEVKEVELLLYHCRRGKDVILVWMHVDDGVVVSNSASLRDQVKEGLEKSLKLKWQDGLKKIVGIKVEYSDGVTLSQTHLATQIIKHAEEYFQRPLLTVSSTPPDGFLVTHTEGGIDDSEFQSFIGSLNYLAIGTRPDISYAVNLLSRHSAHPHKEHWLALQHLLGYVKGTKEQGLHLNPVSDDLELWVDAGWGGEFQRSTSGFVVRFGGSTIAWSSRRQKVVAMSTCAAEYIAIGAGIEFLLFLNELLTKAYKVVPTTIFCINKIAILVAEDNSLQGKLKHIGRNFFYVNDIVRRNNFKLSWVSTVHQLANIFTKRLPPVKHSRSRKLIM